MKHSYNEFPFDICLQTLFSWNALWHMPLILWLVSLWSTVPPWEGVGGNYCRDPILWHIMCLHKPHYWLQALMLICSSSSEGGRSKLGWATLSTAADLKDFLKQQVHELHIGTTAVSARGAGLSRSLSVLIHTTNRQISYKKDWQCETSASTWNLVVTTDTGVGFGHASVPCPAVMGCDTGGCTASVTNCKACWSPACSPEPSSLILSCLKDHLVPLPRLDCSICMPWSQGSILTKHHLGGSCGFPLVENVVS